MEHRKIFFCKRCGTLDYAEDRCPKCGSTEIDRADMEFLLFGSGVVRSSAMQGLLAHGRFTKEGIEKIG